jgi:Neuraminidase (sialidase)
MFSQFKEEKSAPAVLSQTDDYGIQLHKSATFRPDLPLAWFVHDHGQSGILGMGIGTDFDMPQSAAGVLSISTDKGKTWQIRNTCELDNKQLSAWNTGPFCCTRKGTLILVFRNLAEKSLFKWDDQIRDVPGATLPTYVTRSLDGGKTWRQPVKLHDEWTGANRAIIQTRTGAVVFTSMKMLHQPGRHAVLTYRSEDEGATWEPSPSIDLGGIGHHGGVTESALVELSDGRLMQYIRTNWGQFWKAISDDDGKTFHPYGPTGIDASSAPCCLCRLRSGRIALFWNRWSPQGVHNADLKGGDCNWSETPVSNFRAELSLSFSEDDGASWSDPVVIACNPGGHLSYPCAFEAAPGEIWVTLHWVRFGEGSGRSNEGVLRFAMLEDQFI